MRERFFILRDTMDPDGDLRRGFSGNVNSWFKIREEALSYAERNNSLVSPKQCPVSNMWCGDPEKGLSGFVFTSAAELEEAMGAIASYVEWHDAPTVTVFASNDIERGVGLDGEDVFRDGWKVITLPYPFSWETFETALEASLTQDAPAKIARDARVQEIVRATVNEWIADPTQPNVQSAWCITQGPCVEFAMECMEKILAEFPGIDIALETSDEVAEDLGLEFGGYHAFLRVDSRYYDSQEQGVPDPTMLPFIGSEYRYAAIFLKEGDNVDEDEETLSYAPV